mmetsp:Transcript_18348/g.39650  ORF Transcript_18348/g.39650 Transcript_18348/m.39650 type:complete len:211 (-) Transcript_18348:89-721(-)|eukprot:CAMPEP_0168749912 /NCGR_PEP_ID=MMETSP0724-20121128/16979_1 /TAXON_ID=265536 /ORGANISM="Amphiprora sp., Strain CCMP467" /LENGTH=210 /DNA_ID=CAMNT_0008797873 /DNA_START=187 /DNA_END=819 /DNA_ORIENTATION=+
MSTTTPIIVGIAGGSGSGKTTLTKKLLEILGEANVCCLNHDSFYHDQSHKEVEERAKTNFDHPDSLDTDLMLNNLRILKSGDCCNIPIYDFATHSRIERTMMVKPRKIILLDGILLFTHPELAREMDIRVFVDASADVRLSRRLQRDIAERGRTVDQVLHQYHATVKPMHEAWVEPSKVEADLIVHSEGHSMDVTIEMLTNHLKVKAGIF